MGWSKDEFWRSNPREFEALYYQYAINQGWYKTKAQVAKEKAKEEAEKKKVHNENVDKLRDMVMKKG